MACPFVSLVIPEYIDETFKGPSILPKDPYDRALARFWARFLDDKVVAVVNAFLGKGKEQEKGKEEVCEMLKVLEKELKDKKLFVGDKFGFADIAANLVGLWMGVFQEASGVVSRNSYLRELMSCLLFIKLTYSRKLQLLLLDPKK